MQISHLLRVERDRLFQKQMLARLESLHPKLVARCRGGGDDHGINPGILEKGVPGHVTLQTGIGAGLIQPVLTTMPESDRFQFRDAVQRGQMHCFAEAETGDGNSDRALERRSGGHGEPGSG